MSINAINVINNTQASAPLTNLIEKMDSAKVGSVSNGQSFVSEFKTALDNISQTQISAHGKAKSFEMGDPNTSLNEVMVDMQKSSVSLQFGIQVRNKLVASYQEIMNMNI